VVLVLSITLVSRTFAILGREIKIQLPWS